MEKSSDELMPSSSSNSGSCILCGSRDGMVVYEERGFMGRLCSCGIVYIDPMPDNAAINPEFDLHLESYYSLPARMRVDWIQKYAPGKKLLDVGAGNGAIVSEACRRGFIVAAVEPNKECAKKLTDKYGIQVEATTIQNSQLSGDQYNVIFHIDLLSHFSDPLYVLKKMSSMLDPDRGVLCFEVGVFGGMSKKWYPLAGAPGFPHHRWFFSEKNISDLLERADLTIVAKRSFNIAPSTILSSFLMKIAPGGLKKKPEKKSLKAEKPSLLWWFYHYLHYVLRYRVGAFLPRFGPSTMFVVAEPKNSKRSRM